MSDEAPWGGPCDLVRGQSIVEYAILLGVITAALVGIQLYAKRGIQAGIKVAADQVGSQRRGLEDIDLRLIWKIKGNSQIATRTNAARVIQTAEEGARTDDFQANTNSQGTLSVNLFAEPGQQ